MAKRLAPLRRPIDGTLKKEEMNVAERIPAVLLLEDGRIFRGNAFGAVGKTFGEAVFSTAMTGYQEGLTDPSYHGQIVVSTAPQIGNTGWNDIDGESLVNDPTDRAIREGMSGKIWAAGYVIRDYATVPQSWRMQRTLLDEMIGQNIVGIKNIDTRALVRHLRDHGAMRSGIFSGDAITTEDEMLAEVLQQPKAEGQDLASEVTTKETYVLEPEGEPRFEIGIIDFGLKANSARHFVKRGLRVHVMPSFSTWEDIEALNLDGLFLSNGPGDPATADSAVEMVQAALSHDLPIFGVCFGNQVLGRALGLNTYKMTFGHRGINIPVRDHRTGRILITAQNHGFCLEGEPGMEFDTLYGRARIAFSCPNDDTVEGVELLDGPAFSVQFHPEASAGPHDAQYLFDRFVDVLEARSQEGNK